MAFTTRLLRAVRAVAIVFLAFVALGFARAQTPPEFQEYLLRAGDKINLTLIGAGDEAITSELTIPQDGRIAFYNIQVQAAGRTRDQVRADLIAGIKKYVLDPEVTINLLSSPYNVISVNGAVGKPAEYNYRRGMTLFQALTLAGGVSSSANTSGFVYRKEEGKDPRVIQFDAQALFTGDLTQDVTLQPGDIIQINIASVFVSGRVSKPGTFPLQSADTVAKAITASGGLGQDPDLEHAFIRRKTEQITVDLRDYQRGNAQSPALQTPLQPGDELVVPEIQSKVMIFGDVGIPGYVYLLPKERDKALDAIAQAGGAHPTSDLEKVRLQRLVNGAPVSMDLNIGPKGEPSDNVILQDGDFLYIPAKRERSRTDSLASASLIGNLLLVLRNL